MVGRKKKKSEVLKNVDLWKEMDAVVEGHEVDWRWVKGHAGNKYNEICDELATSAGGRLGKNRRRGIFRVIHSPFSDASIMISYFFRRTAFTGILLVASIGIPEAADFERAEALFKASKWKESEIAYRAGLKPDPGPETRAGVLLKIGYCLERQNQWESAIANYRTILEMKEASAEKIAKANLRTGYSMRRLSRNEPAIPFLMAAAENEKAAPNTRAEGYLYTAWAYGVLGKEDEARKTFRKVISVPEAHGNLIATAYLNIGRSLQSAGKYEEALAAYRKIQNFNPVAATNRSRTRIYILECEALLAGDNPFHIKPCAVDVGSEKATLFWVSQGEKPPDGSATLHSGESAVAETIPLPETICRKHKVRFEKLSPGTAYRYMVTCGSEKIEGAFRTSPTPGTSFSFSVLGDTQSYFESLQPLYEALGAEKTDFVLHVGDLVDRGNLWGEWKGGFFDPGWSYLQSSILRPAFGNHDGGPFYPAFFQSSHPTLYYSFDWGDARFVVLDSYGPGSGGEGRKTQLAWLEKILKKNDKTWTIVSLHVPMVATRKRIKWFGSDDFLPLLEKHGVDLVFSGHHPLYRRYLPIGEPAILHVTSGGGGGPVGGFVPSPLLEKGVGSNHYCRVDVGPDRLRLVAKDIEGKVIDEFELTRDWRETRRAETVPARLASRILPLYQELLTDRTFELLLQAGKRTTPRRNPHDDRRSRKSTTWAHRQRFAGGRSRSVHFFLRREFPGK